MISTTNREINYFPVQQKKKQEDSTRYPEIIGDETGVYERKLGYADTRVADYIDLNEQFIKLETQEHFLCLEYRGPDRQIKKLDIPANVLANSKKVAELSKYGVGVDFGNKNQVLCHLINRKGIVSCFYKHSHIGFSQSSQGIYFKHHQLLGKNSPGKSTYSGDLDIKPTGSEKKWRALIKRHVCGNSPMELAVVMGLASAVVGFISREMSMENIIAHIINDSSTGKTTACQLAISVFGSPVIKGNGLMLSWNGTVNAIQRSLTGNNGVVIALDEVSMSRGDDFTKIIYSFSEGKETSRMTSDLTMQESGTWSTLIISTGEKSLFGNSKQNTGLRVRLIELSDIIWTTSAVQSDEIKETVTQNYGHIGPKFVIYLMDLGKERVLKMMNHWSEQMERFLPESPITTRIANKLAVFMVTGELANQKFKWGFDLNKIGTLLIKNETEKLEEAELGHRAIANLVDYISIKKKHFFIESGGESSPSNLGYNDVWGKIIYHPSTKNHDGDSTPQFNQIIIIYKVIMEILKDLKYETPEIVIKQWKKEGWLNHEKGKNTRKRILNGDDVNCIILECSKIPYFDRSINKKDGRKKEITFKTAMEAGILKKFE